MDAEKLARLAQYDPTLARSAQIADDIMRSTGHDRLRARVALCLDLSFSMQPFFANGSIDILVGKLLALGLTIDDDGEIDIYLFGNAGYEFGTRNELTYRTFSRDLTQMRQLEAHTNYAEGILTVREAVKRAKSPDPTIVLFLTDGGADDRSEAERQLRKASAQPIFIQFVAIHRSAPLGTLSSEISSDFEFLQELDAGLGDSRVVDNAGFCAISDPGSIPDDQLFKAIFSQYPRWLADAKRLGIVKN